MQTLEIVHEDSIATVWLNRPDVRNAFNAQMIAELTAAFSQLANAPDVRAIVLGARGSAFCAGADLNWMKSMAQFSDAENLADAGTLAEMLRVMDQCPKPIIARVQGDCYAGGLGLIAVCDVVVAADAAQFCLSEVKLGLIPATISPYVIRAMGQQAARRYFLTAERFDAHEAHRIGMVHIMCPPDALDTDVARIAQALRNNSPHAVMRAKQLVEQIALQDISDALIANTAQQIASIRASSEGREGVKAFLDKRKPTWLVNPKSEGS